MGFFPVRVGFQFGSETFTAGLGLGKGTLEEGTLKIPGVLNGNGTFRLGSPGSASVQDLSIPSPGLSAPVEDGTDTEIEEDSEAGEAEFTENSNPPEQEAARQEIVSQEVPRQEIVRQETAVVVISDLIFLNTGSGNNP
jgi:hypothetical protein